MSEGVYFLILVPSKVEITPKIGIQMPVLPPEPAYLTKPIGLENETALEFLKKERIEEHMQSSRSVAKTTPRESRIWWNSL